MNLIFPLASLILHLCGILPPSVYAITILKMINATLDPCKGIIIRFLSWNKSELPSVVPVFVRFQCLTLDVVVGCLGCKSEKPV